ncbi:unnamed protein product [Effrenium voratum]|nr:unnamed protein product [Effrenium voratum]
MQALTLKARVDLLRPLPLGSAARLACLSTSWRKAAVEWLQRLQQLSLAPYSQRVDDDALLALVRHCVCLQEVNLCGCCITDRGLQGLLRCGKAGRVAAERACRQLSSLNLSCLPRISADALEELCAQLPVQWLELSGCTGIREVDLVRRFGRFMDLDEDEDGLNKVQG